MGSNPGSNKIKDLIQLRFCNLADCFSVRFKSLVVDKKAELDRYREFAVRVRPMVIETVSFLHEQLQDGKSILVEGANAAMLDLDFGESSRHLKLYR